MSDPWSQYEAGLDRLLTRLGQDHPRYTEALVLQQRLLENVRRVRLYGDTETNRAERAQIFAVLNRLTLEAVGSSFNDLFLQDGSTATLRGSGAIAQGKGAVGAGASGVAVGDGAVVFGDVKVERGDFVGRDQVTLQGDGNVVGDGSVAIMTYREQALDAAREAGDRAAEGAALDKLGSAYAARGDSRRAVEHYEQAIAVARELNDQRAEALYSQNLGLALLRLAEDEPAQSQAYLSRAAAALQQAISLLDAIKAAPLLRARTRYHLGRCYHQSGRWPEAIALLEQAREVFARHKARPELAHALLELGQLYYQTGDFESAYIYLKDALRLFRRLGDTDGIAVTQEALGSMELQAAHPSDAIASLREARQGYVALQRDERVHAVDHLLGMADRARQSAERMGATP